MLDRGEGVLLRRLVGGGDGPWKEKSHRSTFNTFLDELSKVQVKVRTKTINTDSTQSSSLSKYLQYPRCILARRWYIMLVAANVALCH